MKINPLYNFYKGFIKSSNNKYSTINNFKNNLNPYYLTGFVDGEGCFHISLRKVSHHKTGFRVELSFSIGLHKKDKFVLEAIKNYLGIGNVHKQGTDSVQYRVSSIKDLQLVIDHFDKYPLISQKFGDYSLFKQAYLLLINK